MKHFELISYFRNAQKNTVLCFLINSLYLFIHVNVTFIFSCESLTELILTENYLEVSPFFFFRLNPRIFEIQRHIYIFTLKYMYDVPCLLYKQLCYLFFPKQMS